MRHPVGIPLVEATRRRRSRQLTAVPTGEATTATSTAWAATATASATPHTKGLYTQLVAATTVEITGLLIGLTAASSLTTADSSALLDIAVGAVLSEVVVIPNLGVGYKAAVASNANSIIRIPIAIPVGSRIAIACQGVESLKTIALLVQPLTRIVGAPSPSRSVVTIGANTATSRGVTIATPGATNTKGAWTEITPATTEPFSGLGLSIQGGADTSLANGTGLLDIAIGAAGAEVTVISNVHISLTSLEAAQAFDAGAWSVDIPPGARLSARVALTSLTNTVDVHLHGIR